MEICKQQSYIKMRHQREIKICKQRKWKYASSRNKNRFLTQEICKQQSEICKQQSEYTDLSVMGLEWADKFFCGSIGRY